ncbi:MAG: DUF481 domain-containing protein [Gemmatimonadetes bacterium]|nr:DUF481 domain-containing protein [Gemmatimonadota bacterium]MYG16613.1 DUF481 domain-containing protein [Gemmatimonadota bacterium]
MRYLYLLVLLPLALASGHSAAQVNIEALRGDTDAAGFSGALALNLEMHTGNTDLKEIGLEGRLDFDHPRVHTFLLARNDFGWEQGERFADEGLIHLRQHYPLHGRFGIEAFTQYNYDTTYRLDARALAGGGLRFHLVESEVFQLWEGASAFVEHERLSELMPTDDHPDNATVVRWSHYLSSRIAVNDRVVSTCTVYFQPLWNEIGDTRILGELNLEIDLAGPLVLALNFVTRYDSRPPEGVSKLDTVLENGLAVTF